MAEINRPGLYRQSRWRDTHPRRLKQAVRIREGYLDESPQRLHQSAGVAGRHFFLAVFLTAVLPARLAGRLDHHTRALQLLLIYCADPRRVTAYDSPEHRAHALVTGFNGFLPKPVSFDALTAILEQFLGAGK